MINPAATISKQRDRAQFWLGFRHAIGAPALVLGASILGFGALIKGLDLHWFVGVFATATIFALPGQVAFIELYGVGAGMLALAIAVTGANVRLLPMTVVMIAAIRRKDTPRWQLYLLSHFVAASAWVWVMGRKDQMEQRDLLPYFSGFAFSMLVCILPMPVLGYYLVDRLPTPLAMALVFAMPLYFASLLSREVRDKGRLIAIVSAAIASPIFHLLDPVWGMIWAGLLAGAVVFIIELAQGERLQWGERLSWSK